MEYQQKLKGIRVKDVVTINMNQIEIISFFYMINSQEINKNDNTASVNQVILCTNCQNPHDAAGNPDRFLAHHSSNLNFM